MRLVVQEERGVLALNYSWLPTWLGLNTPLKQELEDAISKHLVGKEMTEEVLDEAHHLVVSWFSQRFPQMEGLADHLDSLKFVHIR